MRNIFEQPWLLLIVSAVALLVVFVFRAVFPQRRKWWLWLLPVLLAALSFALDFFVETDAEKVRAVLARAVKVVEKENAELLTPLFSDDYRDSFHASREALLNNCRWWLSGPIIEKNVLRIVSLEVKPPNARLAEDGPRIRREASESRRAEAVFTVRVVFDPQGPVFEYRKMMLFKLRADFREERGGWFFSRVEVLEIDLQPADWRHIQGGAGEIF